MLDLAELVEAVDERFEDIVAMFSLERRRGFALANLARQVGGAERGCFFGLVLRLRELREGV